MRTRRLLSRVENKRLVKLKSGIQAVTCWWIQHQLENKSNFRHSSLRFYWIIGNLNRRFRSRVAALVRMSIHYSEACGEVGQRALDSQGPVFCPASARPPALKTCARALGCVCASNTSGNPEFQGSPCLWSGARGAAVLLLAIKGFAGRCALRRYNDADALHFWPRAEDLKTSTDAYCVSRTINDRRHQYGDDEPLPLIVNVESGLISQLSRDAAQRAKLDRASPHRHDKLYLPRRGEHTGTYLAKVKMR
ncbi:hypothetical protein EVAR_38783_1 [Eumeta japonica]|uniref:Uncharacterized protein n=1 Tax=Eumeta variegata TaxID=151549 RepID=A0A4C1WM51_EUMVA|nr:hypothetical protein EVAR_38783_1 [Eumeta japonica]